MELFRQELYRLNTLPPTSLLSIHLQARVLPAAPCSNTLCSQTGHVPGGCVCSSCADGQDESNLLHSTCCSSSMQAGLSALKTPLSLEPGCCREDPLHLPAFRTLAEGLPFAKHVHSKLICAISHTLMNEHNPPAALPNGCVERHGGHGGEVLGGMPGGQTWRCSSLCALGSPLALGLLARLFTSFPPFLPPSRYVYSQKALHEMAAANSGRVTCPRTGFSCEVSELRRVYIS